MTFLDVEREKYREVWDIAKYREHSPGEVSVARFQSWTGLSSGDVYDFGCGEGRGSIALAQAGWTVLGWDLVDVRSEAGKAAMRGFVEAPLWERTASMGMADAGYCVDVMEHLPTEFVMLAVDAMLTHCVTLYLEISNEPDNLGGLIGQPLHLTVREYAWWRDRLREVGRVIDARDLMGRSSFILEQR